MPLFPPAIQNLIDEFEKLPGIGPKVSQRFVFYLLSLPQEESNKLVQALIQLKEKITTCSTCQNFSERDPCPICADPRRDRTILCLITKPQDLMVIEKTHEFKGLYHVLGGTLSPLEGITPEQLKIKELLTRIKKDSVREIILALNPDLEGESTALYLIKQLKPFKIKITRLARGLPMGSDLEYADEVTLTQALKGRKEI